MPGVEEEAVSPLPCRILWVIYQKFREQNIHEVCATHCASRMSGFCFLYHRCSQDSDIVGCLVHYFNVVHLADKIVSVCKNTDISIADMDLS